MPGKRRIGLQKSSIIAKCHPADGGKIAETPLETRQHNERVRTCISVLSNGGLALVVAYAGITYSGAGTDGALFVVIAGVFLISGSFAASVLLREEV
jgi:hypothetical protein